MPAGAGIPTTVIPAVVGGYPSSRLDEHRFPITDVRNDQEKIYCFLKNEYHVEQESRHFPISPSFVRRG
jgi:hypothetical protein